MPNLVRPATKEVRSRIFDSALWADYRPRADDIVVATYPKCGTTWTQRIVSMLVAASAAPTPVVSPWFDMRLFGPVEAQLELAESLTSRRIFKSHLPYDAMPLYEGVKFIHVARDGRDSAMSFHNHLRGFLPHAWQSVIEVSRADPKFGDDPPETEEDPAEYFKSWLADDGGAFGDPGAGYFYMENSYWAARHDPNLLMVHYNDLKADREGEIRRIAAFLGITLPDAVWPQVVEGAGFETMREQGAQIIPFAEAGWDGGAKRFLYKGTNGRWQNVVAQSDLDRYAAQVKAAFNPALAAWLEHGRAIAGDPTTTAD